MGVDWRILVALEPPTSEEWYRLRRSWKWAIRLSEIPLFGSLLIYEWNRWPNGSPLLGPLGFVWYNGSDPCSLACCFCGLLLIFAFPFKPSAPTAILSLLGLLLWFFMGMLADGIGC